MPVLVFQLDPASFATGVSVSILAASAGGIFVLRKVFALTPADAIASGDYDKITTLAQEALQIAAQARGDK